jgi:hypothetical protein
MTYSLGFYFIAVSDKGYILRVGQKFMYNIRGMEEYNFTNFN